jgi:predicted ester cyclase
MTATDARAESTAVQANVSAVRRFWDGFNDHDLSIWDEVCAAGFINHDPGLPTPDADLTTIKHTIGALLAAFPDLRSTEDELIVADDMVVVRRTMRGTHRGEFAGVAATGNAVTFSGIWLAHLDGGKLQEQWVSFDALGLLRQIGAIPAPG